MTNLSLPVVQLIDHILVRGRAAGSFRADVDAIDVHMMISSYCVFPINNRHTFGKLFNRDLIQESRREYYRGILGDAVVAWLTASG